MLVDFGDFVDRNPESQADPYMQLLSVTDPADAHNDFVQSRLSTSSAAKPKGQDNPSKKASDNDAGRSANNFIGTMWPCFIVSAIILLL